MRWNCKFCRYCEYLLAVGNQAPCYGCKKGSNFELSGIYEVKSERDTDSKKPMTNGDRIRAMTDEELAEFILDKRENGTCFNNKCYHNDPNKGCDDCTLEWLKQPAE